MFNVGDKVKVLVGDHKGCTGQVKEVKDGALIKVTVDQPPAGIPASIYFLEKDLQSA